MGGTSAQRISRRASYHEEREEHEDEWDGKRGRKKDRHGCPGGVKSSRAAQARGRLKAELRAGPLSGNPRPAADGPFVGTAPLSPGQVPAGYRKRRKKDRHGWGSRQKKDRHCWGSRHGNRKKDRHGCRTGIKACTWIDCGERPGAVAAGSDFPRGQLAGPAPSAYGAISYHAAQRKRSPGSGPPPGPDHACPFFEPHLGSCLSFFDFFSTFCLSFFDPKSWSGRPPRCARPITCAPSFTPS